MPHHCSLVPPYVLQAVARHEDAAVRDAAIATLGLDRTFAVARLLNDTARRAQGLLAAPPRLHRRVHDAGGTEALPGALVRDEGAPPTLDPAADEAYDGLGATWRFYEEVLGRSSIDGAGMDLVGTVHFGDRYDNAYWDGERMVFGDGDGVVFTRFTASLDVIGHELTHGVTGALADLEYRGQPGALNESVSDVFGSLVKQYALGQTAEQADWLIGAQLLAPGVHGVALRSMRAPGTAYDDPRLGGRDPQPAHLRDLVRTTGDSGGVHLNSGIPNHAFFLAAQALGGCAWERAGRIWFEVLAGEGLPRTATFAQFARRTVEVARDRFGADGRGAVADAWAAVGVAVP